MFSTGHKLFPTITSSYLTLFWGYVSINYTSVWFFVLIRRRDPHLIVETSTVYTFLFVFISVKKSLSETISATSFVYGRIVIR